jgi:hypothetical protein
LPSDNADIVGGSSTDININPILLLEQMNHQTLFGYEYFGVNASNGNPIYVKANGALQGNIPTQSYVAYTSNPTNVGTASSLLNSDRKILGNTLPTYFGGFTSTMSYKI